MHLHLDLTAGARGDMIAAALLAVGADRRAANAALAALGLGFVAFEVDAVKRAGLVATRARFVVDGRDFAFPAADAARAPSSPAARKGSKGRHRHATAQPRFDPAHRDAGLIDVKTAAAVEDAPGLDDRKGAGMIASRRSALEARSPSSSPSRSSSSSSSRSWKASSAPHSGRSPSSAWPPLRSSKSAHAALERWLSRDAAVALADVVALVKSAELPPIAKALCIQSLRRAMDALAVVAGPNAKLAGPRAVAMLCEIAAAAALVDALQPDAITASPVALSTRAIVDDGVVGASAWPAPSPWLLEILAGAPVIERDSAAADVAGAAFLRASVHRFGARGVSTSHRQGFGACALDAPGEAIVARALVGDPAPISSRPGRKVATMCDIRALLPRDLDRRALSEELATLGASGLCFVDVDGPASCAVSLAAASAAAEPVVAALWRAGARDVRSSWVDVFAAPVVEVTVPVGRGRTKAGVRVRVWKDGERIARIEPDGDDVEAAAKKRGAKPGAAQAIAAEVVAKIVEEE